MREIIVRKCGAHPGFCAEYYKTLQGQGYVKITHPKTKAVSWYTTNPYNWEPDTPVNLEKNVFKEVTP